MMLIARQRHKLFGLRSSEKNRMHKVLTDAGIRLGVEPSGTAARGRVDGVCCLTRNSLHSTMARLLAAVTGTMHARLRAVDLEASAALALASPEGFPQRQEGRFLL
jgi:hypothetical protein